MRKGNFGVAYSFYAAVAMFIAILALDATSFILPLLGITLFVIAAEKDEWTSKMCIQACGVVGIYRLYKVVMDLISGLGDNSLFRRIQGFNEAAMRNAKSYKKSAKASKAYDKFNKFWGNWNDVVDFITFLIYILLIVLLIVAIVKVMKQKDAGLPMGTKFANWAFGLVVARPAAPQYVQPQQMVAPQQAAPQATGKKFCTGCGAEVTGPFCTKCGKQA